jgi:formylglycine-generating enzyme required for sulfatase activity/serine/threonine protein kinase
MPPLKLENHLLNQRYQVLRRVAEGSYAEIYEAFDQRNQRVVIIKALNLSLRGEVDETLRAKLLANFDQEARALALLRHPNIVQLLDQGSAERERGFRFRYLALEYLAGGALFDHCHRRPLTLDQTLGYFRQVADALSAAHERGVIHRDLTPSNLLLSADKQIIKISDFGVAKILERDDQKGITRVGTALYAPPEHHPFLEMSDDPLTPAADVYSMAKTMWLALTGAAPHEFRGRPIDRLPPSLAAQPCGPKLLEALGRATATNVAERYATVTEFWRDLSSLQNRSSLASPNETPSKVEDEPAVQRGRIVIALTTGEREALSQPKNKIVLSRNRSDSKGKKIGVALSSLILSAAMAGALFQPLSGFLSAAAAATLAALGGLTIGTSLVFLVLKLLRRHRERRDEAPKLSKFEFEVAIATGQAIERRKGEAQCFREMLAEDVELEMVAIPAGTFMMGSPESEAGRVAAEGPQRLVAAPSFFMSRYPVTQRQWSAVAQLPRVNLELNPQPSTFRGFSGERLPVESVSWREAVEFCERLSRHTGRQYRLPSEAEWEYACRAGTTTPFHCGATLTPELACYDGRLPYGAAAPSGEPKQAAPVDQSGLANAFGLSDMHGNVWEWVADEWLADYQGAPADASARTSGDDAANRVARGGSWFNVARLCRSAYRFSFPPDNRRNDCGFRVVMTMRQ